MKNLDTIFPFYDSLEQQYRYKPDIDITNVPLIIVSDETMVPWIIRRDHSDGTIYDIDIWIHSTNSAIAPIHITGSDASVSITTGPTYDYIAYTGHALPAPLPPSQYAYYMIVEDTHSDELWYSETFAVRESMASYLKLTFSNETEIAGIMEKFVQVMYIDQDIKAPEYLREDEGDKRDGLLVFEKQVKIKSDIIRINQAPEYVTDALIILPFNDNISVTDQNGYVYTYDAASVNSPEWSQESNGYLGKLDLHLMRDIVIKKLTYKEIGGAIVAAVSIIKQGGPVTMTPALGGGYSYNVVFEDDMPDADYTPYCYMISTGEMADAQLPAITNITKHGFLATHTIECTIRWTAIKV